VYLEAGVLAYRTAGHATADGRRLV
jgi:hypothetical protein